MLDYGLLMRLNSRPKYVNEEEIEHIRQVRNAVIYGGARNSLVEWMLSDEWTKIPTEGVPLSISGEIG